MESSNRQGCNFLLFLVKALVWGLITWYIAGEFAANQFWFVVLSIFLFSIPICLCGIYSNTICQIRRLTCFARRGLIFRLLSSRPLKVLFWICWALGTSFFMLIQFHTYHLFEWLVFFLTIPVFWCIFTLSRRCIARELKPYLVTHLALAWSRGLSTLVMLTIYVILNVYFGQTQVYHTLTEAIHARKAAVADMTGSAVVWEVSQYLAFYDGVKAYALGGFGTSDTLWALALLITGSFVVFYNACAILSCFLISRVEYRRVFGPLDDADQPLPVSGSRIATVAAVTAFLSLFIYLPVFVYIEAWVQQTPEMANVRKSKEAWVIPKLEQIDESYFKEGTLAQIQAARVEALHKTEVSLIYLESQAERAFDRLEANVDNYLDWYYSLAGEYSRIVNLLVGELEDYMVEKLEEFLKEGDAFKDFQTALNTLLAEHAETMRIYRQTVHDIMEENQIVPAESPFRIVKQVSLQDVLNPPIHQDMISLEKRLMAGGGAGASAGVLTAVVIKKITGKIISKNVLHLSAKALIKVVLGKTAGGITGAGAGSAAGATIGSAFPVIGTAAGAVIGGIVGGIAAGVTVDKLLIQLESLINREELRREIIAAINEARLEFKSKLRG